MAEHNHLSEVLKRLRTNLNEVQMKTQDLEHRMTDAEHRMTEAEALLQTTLSKSDTDAGNLQMPDTVSPSGLLAEDGSHGAGVETMGILEDPDKERKQELLDWISAVLGDPNVAKEPFNQVLKNGVVICQLMNKLSPGSVKRIQKKGTKFTFMENIEAFQTASKAYGLPEEELFMPTDLVEARNIKAVINSLFALARIAQDKGFDGPVMGPKMAHPGEKTDWHAREQEKFAAQRAAQGQ